MGVLLAAASKIRGVLHWDLRFLRDLTFGMGDYQVLRVDEEEIKDIEPVAIIEASESSNGIGVSDGSSSIEVLDEHKAVITIEEEEEPLIQAVECRICQDEDSIKNLDTPCACCGSLKVQ